LAREIVDDEKAVERFKGVLREQARAQLEASARGKHGEDIATLKADVESRRVTRELLRERYQSEMKSVKQFSGDTLSFRFKQEELARAEKVLDLISDRVITLQTEQGAPPRVTRMKPADPPLAPIERLPYKKLLLALLMGFCAPFGLAVFAERITLRVSDPVPSSSRPTWP